ncbi:MAG: HDOD domain-containing protein [Pseudomonadota bacterium]
MNDSETEFLSLRMPRVSPSGQDVLAMLESRDPNIRSVTEAIHRDPVLSSAVLKYANAPMYRRLVEVTNVRQAVSILGLANVRLAVMVASMRDFAGAYRDHPLANAIWAHSFTMAGLMRAIADMVVPRRAEDIELTGLLHEMGALILLTNFPEEYTRLADEALAEDAFLEDREKAFFGVTHNELVGRVIDEIRLPDASRGAITDFPFMEQVPLAGREVDDHLAVLALAHHLHEEAGRQPHHPRERIPDERDRLVAELGLDEADLEALRQQHGALRDSYGVGG